MFGLEIVALTKRQEAELEVAELRMLRFSLGLMKINRISNNHIRGTAQIRRFGNKFRVPDSDGLDKCRLIYWQKDAQLGATRQKSLGDNP